MGYTYEVQAWGEHHGAGNGYSHKQLYTGAWLLGAWRAMRRARASGYKCITLNWRPD